MARSGWSFSRGVLLSVFSTQSDPALASQRGQGTLKGSVCGIVATKYSKVGLYAGHAEYHGTSRSEGLFGQVHSLSTRFTMSDQPPRLLSRAEVCDRTGLSYSTIWRMERGGNFPARRRISANRVAWVEAEVERWMEERQKVTASAKGGGAT